MQHLTPEMELSEYSSTRGSPNRQTDFTDSLIVLSFIIVIIISLKFANFSLNVYKFVLHVRNWLWTAGLFLDYRFRFSYFW